MTGEREKMCMEYLAYARLAGHKESTVERERYRLPHLFAYLDEKGFAFHEVMAKEAQGFQGWLLEKDNGKGGRHSSGGILNILKTAGMFYEYLKAKKLVFSNPFRNIRKIREVRKLPRNLLKEKQMADLLKELERFEEEATGKRKVKRYKVHVVCELLYSTGMRINEAVSLTPGQVDLERGTVTLKETKEGRARICFLNAYACGVLRRYMEKIKPLITYEWNGCKTLFGLKRGRMMQIVKDEIKKAAGKLGFPVITGHGFRHAVGYHLLRAGCPVRYIQAILGHRRLRSTEVYTRVEKDDLRQVMNRCHPRKWKNRERTGI